LEKAFIFPNMIGGSVVASDTNRPIEEAPRDCSVATGYLES
jgi:hypothetical protein